VPTRAHGGFSRATRCIVAVTAATLLWPAFAQFSANRRPPRPNVTLPDGPVRKIVLDSCSACHGIDEYGYYAMSRDAWHALIERMKTARSGLVDGAVISDANREILLDWLVANFGPEATPFEREYVVREVTDETRLTDAKAAALLDRACKSCHSPIEPALGAALDAAGWRSTLTGKIARGAPLLIDEVDPLVDWLLKRHGGR
jgi:cytochrome c5